jgi:hypothetical protein
MAEPLCVSTLLVFDFRQAVRLQTWLRTRSLRGEPGAPLPNPPGVDGLPGVVIQIKLVKGGERFMELNHWFNSMTLTSMSPVLCRGM